MVAYALTLCFAFALQHDVSLAYHIFELVNTFMISTTKVLKLNGLDLISVWS